MKHDKTHYQNSKFQKKYGRLGRHSYIFFGILMLNMTKQGFKTVISKKNIGGWVNTPIFFLEIHVSVSHFVINTYSKIEIPVGDSTTLTLLDLTDSVGDTGLLLGSLPIYMFHNGFISQIHQHYIYIHAFVT